MSFDDFVSQINGLKNKSNLSNYLEQHVMCRSFNTDNTSFGSNLKKYRGDNAAKFTPVNFAIDYNNERLMRFADVILMLAEAKLQSGDAAMAVSLMNEVRARSFPDGAPIAAGDDLVAALVHERQVELAFEGHRLFDLVRWRLAEDAFAAQGKTLRMAGGTAIFPLPQTEIDRSGGKLSQVK